MANFKNVAVLIVLCTGLIACTGQVLQGGLHESQGGTHKSQGVAHKPQVGPRETQGAAHVSQGGDHESQGRNQISQGDAHETQGGTRGSQGGAQISQGGEHESQGGPYKSQGRARRQAVQGAGSQGFPAWTSCDFNAVSKVSCQDCNTRVICKPFGGILKPCSPKKPFCDNGVCSVVPSVNCA